MCRVATPLLILLILLIGFSYACAQDYSQVGLYSDPDRLNKTTPWPTQTTFLELYLVLTHPYDEEALRKVDAVGAFECCIEVPEGDFVVGFDSDVDCRNVASLPELIVVYAHPLTVSRNRVVLGCVTFLTTGQPGTRYYLVPLANSSIPWHMVYYAEVSDPLLPDEQFLLPMYPAEANDPNLAAAKSFPAETESQSWGGVKALYR